MDSIVLRYIDAVPYDDPGCNVLTFLREKLKVQASLPEVLFKGTGVASRPEELNWQMSFVCNSPAGRVHLRFATGTRKGAPALLWETMVQTVGDDVPPLPSEFPAWLEAAHSTTHDWFFKLIEGDLERRFRGE